MSVAIEAIDGGLLHNYDVPCIATWPIDQVFRSYADWIDDSVG